jgi:hypothetical protein
VISVLTLNITDQDSGTPLSVYNVWTAAGIEGAVRRQNAVMTVTFAPGRQNAEEKPSTSSGEAQSTRGPDSKVEA